MQYRYITRDNYNQDSQFEPQNANKRWIDNFNNRQLECLVVKGTQAALSNPCSNSPLTFLIAPPFFRPTPDLRRTKPGPKVSKPHYCAMAQ